MHHDRINISPETPKKGQETLINYRGLLAQSGADEIWLHYGFDNWRNPNTVYMNRVDNNDFNCSIKSEGKKELNFCFKDSAGHWDNNNGQDWSVHIR